MAKNWLHEIISFIFIPSNPNPPGCVLCHPAEPLMLTELRERFRGKSDSSVSLKVIIH